MNGEPNKIGRILKLLNRPEELREALLQLREELIKAGGRPVSRRSAWNVGSSGRMGEDFGVDRETIRKRRTIRAPEAIKEQEAVIDVFPSEKTLDVYAHFPRVYKKEDINVKLESSEGEQKLCIATPDSTSTVDLGAKVKGFEWRLNNDTLIVSIEKEEL